MFYLLQKLIWINLIALLGFIPVCSSQIMKSKCQHIFEVAKIKMDSAKYDLAIKKLTAFKICASSVDETRKADDLIAEVYSRVNAERKKAEDEREKANTARNRAEILRDSAKLERDKAKQEALNAKISLMIARSGNQLGKNNTLAFRYAEQAYALNPTVRNNDAYTQLLNCYSRKGSFFKKFNPKIPANSAVYHMSFSPNDSLLLIVGSDSVSAILNLMHGNSVELRHRYQPINHGSFSKDGKKVVTAGREVEIYNLKGELQKRLRIKGRYSFAQFLKNDAQLLLASSEKILLVDWVTEKEVFHLDGPKKGIIRATLSDDDKFLAITIRSDSVKSSSSQNLSQNKSCVSIYDIGNQVLHSSKELDGIIYTMDFFYRDKLVLGSLDGEIYEWNLQTKVTRKITSSKDGITALDTRFQNNIIFIDSDNTLKEITSGNQEVSRYDGMDFMSGTLVISHEQKMFACSNLASINLYLTEYSWPQNNFKVTNDSGTAVRMLVNPVDPNLVVIQYDTDKLIQWNIQNQQKQILKNADGLGGFTNLQASFSTSGKELLVNTAIFAQSGIASIKKFDGISMEEKHQIPTMDSIVWFRYLPSGQLVTTSPERKMLKWRENNGSVEWSYPLKGGLIDFSYDSSGKKFIILTEDSGNQKVEQVEYKWKAKVLIQKPKGTISNIAVSDDGTTVAYIHSNLQGVDKGAFVYFVEKDSTVKVSDQSFDSVSISSGTEPLILFGSGTPVLADDAGGLIFTFRDIVDYRGSMTITRDGKSIQYLRSDNYVSNKLISPLSLIKEINEHGIWDGGGVKSLKR